MNILKNTFKAFATALCLIGASVVSSYGAVASVTTTSANTNSILSSNQVYIASVTIANNTAQPLQVALFDAPTNVLTFSASAYTNYTTYATNYVVVFTNFSGVVQSNTNAAVFTEARSIPAATRNYRLLVYQAVGASSTVTYNPIGGLTTDYGICSTNNTNCTITVTYSGLR